MRQATDIGKQSLAASAPMATTQATPGVDGLALLAPRYRPYMAYAQAGFGLTSYVICVYILWSMNLGDPELEAEYASQVTPATYQWPMVAFGTAFMLNLITLVFERESSKNQLALLACYINLLAGINDLLSWKGVLPIRKDTWGQGQQLGRMLMWLHTTPTMVYLLGMISNFSTRQVMLAMGADVVMTVCGTWGQMVHDPVAVVILHAILLTGFAYIVGQMWRMFDSALADAQSDASVTSLKMLRLFTVGLWFLFPAIFIVVKLRLVDVQTEEWLWTVGDFLGKVMFSSSLLQGNFLTIDQRKLMTRRIVEEANRVQMIEELRELVEYKERFMSGMSHELRTPLNGIIGLSEAILVGSCGEISEAVSKTISTIKTSGARLLALINDILDAASMKQRKGSLTIKQEKVGLKRVVEDVLELCQPLARRGVKLVNNIPHGLPPVLGDTGRLIQIFHNLVGNSCKFTHAGTISVSATYKVDEVEICVADTGIGIPEDKLSTIFQAFEQVDMSTTRKYGGTGLGLSLVKQLVEAHSTAITVKSKLNMGTSFFFTLKVWESKSEAATEPPSPGERTPSGSQQHELHPSSAGRVVKKNPSIRSVGEPGSIGTGRSSTADGPPARAPSRLGPLGVLGSASGGFKPPGAEANDKVAAALAARSAAIAQQHHGSGRKSVDSKEVFMPSSVGARVEVLSVDDDPVNQMVIQNLLAPAGYTITQAMDGMTALETLNSMGRLPDIILLDVMMPGMSGYEVCRTLREKYPGSPVPIIMISAKSKEEDIVEGLASGANDYVVKPFGRTEILARIATHLRFTRADLMSTRSDILGKDTASSGSNARHAKAAAAANTAAAMSQLVAARSRTPSLPAAVKDWVQGKQASTTLMFDQLSLVAWTVTNLESLQDALSADDLTVGLATLHQKVDGLLEQCGNMYMPDTLELGCCTAIAGLDKSAQHAEHALQFATGLVEAAAGVKLPGGRRLHVSVGVHTMPAQAVVVGAVRPVLHVVGQLMHVACQLLGACAENCVHVSGKIRAAASADTTAKLVHAGALGQEATYLLQVGQWQESLPAMAAACARHGPATSVVDTSAVRLSPVQRALVSMAAVSPAALLTLGAAAGEKPTAGIPDSEAVAALRHDKEVLQRQLDEVSEEAARLQDEVDQLTAKLQAAQASSTNGTLTQEGAAQQQERIQQLEQLLAATTAELQAVRASSGADAKRGGSQSHPASGSHLSGLLDAGLSLAGARLVGTGMLASTGSGSGSGLLRSASHMDDGGSGLMMGGGPGGGLGGASTPSVLSGAVRIAPRSTVDSRRSSVIGSPANRLNVSLPAAAATDIAVLLGELGLGELVPRFQAEQITPDLVTLMDDATLKDLGVTSLGSRIKLKLAAQGVLGGGSGSQ